MTDTHGLPIGADLAKADLGTADSATADPSAADPSAADPSALTTSTGKTTIADTVVSKIAGIATKEVVGVHAVGGGASRTVGALRERIPGATVDHSQGVAVEVGEREAAIDIDIVADYGVAIAELAAAIRRNVIAAVEGMTGLHVIEVNIDVHDVHLDDDAGEDSRTAVARVQ